MCADRISRLDPVPTTRPWSDKEGSGFRKVMSLCGMCRGGAGANKGVRPM